MSAQTHSTKLIELLQNTQPADVQEKQDIQKICELVSTHENIYERQCLEAHMTGSALVINPDTKEILLHNHKKLQKWLQFGGHADGETDLAQVALKEAQEETGLDDLSFFKPKKRNETVLPIDVEVQTIPENKGVPEHLHLDLRYILQTSATETPTPEEHESQELEFFSFKEVEAIQDKIDPALLRLISKAKQLLKE